MPKHSAVKGATIFPRPPPKLHFKTFSFASKVPMCSLLAHAFMLNLVLKASRNRLQM